MIRSTLFVIPSASFTHHTALIIHIVQFFLIVSIFISDVPILEFLFYRSPPPEKKMLLIASEGRN